jgi:hypothetical protein
VNLGNQTSYVLPKDSSRTSIGWTFPFQKEARKEEGVTGLKEVQTIRQSPDNLMAQE